MMVLRLLLRLSVLCLLGFLTACSLLSQSQTSAPETYTLSLDSAGSVAPKGTGPVLTVPAPQAQQGLRVAQIAYTQRPYEIRYYAEHAWVESPARLLHPLLIQAMERSGLFASVTSPSSGVVADVGLDTHLLALQQEFSGASSRGRIVLRAQLIDLNTRKVLASRDLEAAEPVTAPGPYGGVAAINRALGRLMGELSRFAAEGLGQGPSYRKR
jgi:cholesterol transport system auxiliary component